MYFIESLFGFAPDNGDGSVETIVLLAVVIVVTGLGLGYFHTRYDERD